MLVKSRLSIIFHAGYDEQGEEIFKTKSFQNIKEEATNEQMLQVVQALLPLQQYEVNRVERTNVHSLL